VLSATATTGAAPPSGRSLDCYRCLVTPSSSPGYGALVVYPLMAVVNVGGCVALTDPSQLACGQAIEFYIECLDRACSGCTDSTTEERDACIADADASVCNTYAEQANTCFTTIQTGPAAQCFDPVFASQLFCGA
jgi:hypothetical protein